MDPELPYYCREILSMVLVLPWLLYRNPLTYVDPLFPMVIVGWTLTISVHLWNVAASVVMVPYLSPAMCVVIVVCFQDTAMHVTMVKKNMREYLVTLYAPPPLFFCSIYPAVMSDVN